MSKNSIIRPIVEFLPLFGEESERGAGCVLFHPRRDDDEPHAYLAGVKEALDAAHGVYLFYDSRGKAIYAGRAIQQSLWKEMNLAYNRDRGDSQQTWRVHHPMTRPRPYDPEQVRSVVREEVPLHEIACYASAFAVDEPLIAEIEALLVRAFANDLLNTRIEKFAVEKA